ncbi:copper resistance protein CopZ [Erysipelothrix larvae]|uniref:Copper resistance protein CopZ n=1 Tax=Erysipelothrix larvae TaxID=1514105 RepID=A0A120JTU0_9FIRM|nr:heavy-metal-associated domain-containing protein [Erysipelothrix larvae]AMC93917.1 copper resistance protein CopZ [Erysipelothrix larvae]
MKKHILFVPDMKCQNCVKHISEELDNTRVDYEISLENKTVSVSGDNDAIHAAKNAIRNAGYTIQ